MSLKQYTRSINNNTPSIKKSKKKKEDTYKSIRVLKASNKYKYLLKYANILNIETGIELEQKNSLLKLINK